MTRNGLLVSIGILLVILVGGSIYIFAVLLPHAGQTSPSTLTSGTATARTNKVRSVAGTIQSLGNQSFVVVPTHGKKTFTVNVSAQTKYTSLTGPVSFSDLKVGQAVNVRGHLDPQDATVLLATSVVINPPSGKISSINGQILTLTTTDGKTVTVHTSSATIISVGKVSVSSAFLVVGETLGYVGTSANDGSVSATNLYLILQHIRGTVTAINGQALTLKTAAGTTQTITLSSTTTYARIGKSTSPSTTPTTINAQAIQVGSVVDVAINSTGTSSTSTAVLVQV